MAEEIAIIQTYGHTQRRNLYINREDLLSQNYNLQERPFKMRKMELFLLNFYSSNLQHFFVCYGIYSKRFIALEKSIKTVVPD